MTLFYDYHVDKTHGAAPFTSSHFLLEHFRVTDHLPHWSKHSKLHKHNIDEETTYTCYTWLNLPPHIKYIERDFIGIVYKWAHISCLKSLKRSQIDLLLYPKTGWTLGNLEKSHALMKSVQWWRDPPHWWTPRPFDVIHPSLYFINDLIIGLSTL